jgi:hypothetical protein
MQASDLTCVITNSYHKNVTTATAVPLVITIKTELLVHKTQFLGGVAILNVGNVEDVQCSLQEKM